MCQPLPTNEGSATRCYHRDRRRTVRYCSTGRIIRRRRDFPLPPSLQSLVRIINNTPRWRVTTDYRATGRDIPRIMSPCDKLYIINSSIKKYSVLVSSSPSAKTSVGSEASLSHKSYQIKYQIYSTKDYQTSLLIEVF